MYFLRWSVGFVAELLFSEGFVDEFIDLVDIEIAAGHFNELFV